VKVITFRKELIALIQSGQKTQTRRIISFIKVKEPGYNQVDLSIVFDHKTKAYLRMIKRYKVGDICQIKNSRFKPETFGFIEILDVVAQTIGCINQEDAKAEGFPDGVCFFMEAFNRINKIKDSDPYKNQGSNLLVWKITFKYHAREPKFYPDKPLPKIKLEG